MTNPATTPYDLVPYKSLAFHEAHPDRLACVARLFGYESPDLAQARILELGCASGGHLMPMAEQLPGAKLAGIDLSTRQIADGQALLAQLGIRNLELLAQGVEQIGPDLGEFDYILAHGLFSWVDSSVRAQILRVCRERLSPRGVAFISYNVYPGWHAFQMLREMMLYHVREIQDPVEAVSESRNLLETLAQAQSDPDGPYAVSLRRMASQIRDRDDTYLLHEYLEDVNEPLYYHDFEAMAAENGLRVIADARISHWPEAQEPEISSALAKLAGNDRTQVEQYLDFLQGRTFRRSILVHESARRRSTAVDFWNLRAQASFRTESDEIDPHDDEPTDFHPSDGRAPLSTSDPVARAVLAELRTAWPLSVPLIDLMDRVQVRLGLGSPPSEPDRDRLAAILNACILRGLIEPHAFEPPIQTTVPDRPQAMPLARRQAQSGAGVVNLWHRVVQPSAMDRLVLGHLDGQTNPREIVERLADEVARGSLQMVRDGQPVRDRVEAAQQLEPAVTQSLRRLAESALLIRNP